MVSLHATVLGELTFAPGETRRCNVMAECSLHVYIEFSLVTSELEKLCQQTEKTLADENYTEVLSAFCPLFLQMHAFKNGNARLLLGFLSVMHFDIPVMVTMNDKYGIGLLCDCHQEVVLCLFI